MNYSFKVTTGGRELLAALLATGEELEITRVAVGSGKVAEDVNLADMTDLIQYVAEGKITQRSHRDNVLYLTVQYASNFTPGLGAFYLAEFIVEARHPVSGESVVLLYATLGDYIQPVNAYSETLPPDIRSYPLAIAISDEIEVTITAPAGLVTYDDLQNALQAFGASVGSCLIIEDFVIPAEGWYEHGLTDPDYADTPWAIDIPEERCTAEHFPLLALHRSSQRLAEEAGLNSQPETLAGAVRIFAETVPAGPLTGTLTLRSTSAPDLGLATDQEVEDAVDGVYGEGAADAIPEDYEVATDEEVQTEVVEGVFGQ